MCAQLCKMCNQKFIFFGNTYTKDGIKLDMNKVRDIEKIPEPKDKEDLPRFLGLIQYMSQYIKHLASKTYHLRLLSKKDRVETFIAKRYNN